jgi:hypothetical protein
MIPPPKVVAAVPQADEGDYENAQFSSPTSVWRPVFKTAGEAFISW